MSSYLNIPLELRQLPQWICWRYEELESPKPTKVPYDAKAPFGVRHASVIDPNTWSTFIEAAEIKIRFGYDGIGFIFTDSDSYAGIDLDDHKGDTLVYDRQYSLFTEFDSYSEISPSGKGLHIICKGSIPSGRKRFGIEVYSSGRFFTMTGNVYHSAPIKERNDLLNQLFQQLGGLTKDGIYIEGDEQKYPDDEILRRATSAVNGEKFQLLIDGNWQNAGYKSQSEGDLAYINIVAFYTQNRPQIRRIYAASILGQTPKGPYNHRSDRVDYVEYMINKSFDNMTPYVDIASLKNSLNEVIGVAPVQVEMFTAADARKSEMPSRSVGTVPPGLMGEIATFIFNSANRPVAEVALTAAIGLMAGICGRAWNIGGAGLNQYVVVLAGTGCGKEAGPLGISKLMGAIHSRVPTSTSFIGPSKIASEAGLIKYIANKSQCFVSVVGEIGYFMDDIGSKHSNSVQRGIRKMLLDLYMKSGVGANQLESAYSDSEKSTGIVKSPSLSIFGESTQYKFFKALDEDMIIEGLLPRFLILEYKGQRVPQNKNHHKVLPPFDVVDRLATLCAHSQSLMHNVKVQDVELNGDATRIMDKLDEYATKQINKSEREVLKELWSRVHLKSLKLAALVAVGCNPYNPIVDKLIAEWAIDIVRGDTQSLIHRFETGEIGTDSEESKQLARVQEAMKQYVHDDSVIEKYGLDRRLHKDRIIPAQFISRRLIADAAFRHDRMGPAIALKRTLQVMIDNGDIREVGKQDMSAKYGFTGRSFMVSNLTIIGVK